jgi:hypothetical protein
VTKGAWKGALGGVVGATSCLLAAFFVHGTIRSGTPPIAELSSSMPLILLLGMAVVAGPGAFVLSLPLLKVLERKAARNAGRGTLLAVAVSGGLILGLVNAFVVVLLIGGPTLVEEAFRLRTFGIRLVSSALGGGLGLGLGCFWGLSRRKEAGA